MEEKLLEVLENICGTDEVREDKNIDIFENGLIDSLGVIELILEIEKEFGLALQPTEIERDDFNTPNKIITYVSKRG